MACEGCAKRRAWIKKWSEVARDRAKSLLAKEPAKPEKNTEN